MSHSLFVTQEGQENQGRGSKTMKQMVVLTTGQGQALPGIWAVVSTAWAACELMSLELVKGLSLSSLVPLLLLLLLFLSAPLRSDVGRGIEPG